MTIDIKRTVLVIEDNELNREMLCAILEPTYYVLQAENGQEGLELLNKYKNKISIILLDIQMPVMNGYEFLNAIKQKQRFSNIPIIVTTSSANALDEIHCLENGATDFVAKPYNSEVILRRVSSMIRLKEASMLINRVEYDDLTEVYSKDFFFAYCERLLNTDLENKYDIICTDINSFQVITERYSVKEVENLLVSISNCLKGVKNGLVGRLKDDVFAVLVPHNEKAFYEDLLKKITRFIEESLIPDAILHMGLYSNVNREIPVNVMCNNALLALHNVRYKYIMQIGEYDDNLKNKLIREQIIVGSMESSLKNGEFKVYYQPKYDIQNNKVGGAEALIRWFHPTLGFLSPGEFIPIFEKNGFISKIGLFMAETVACDLQGWLDSGIAVPISVNVSRIDFENPELADILDGILNKYNIPNELVHFEVTESACSETPEQIKVGVEALCDKGFKIELDDFGAGYSSLGVLDALNFNILKLDMSLTRDIKSKKRKCILKNIFSLAKSLGMEVVAEGIETLDQVTAFKKMGCKYCQGYYYSKPLPKNLFEEYLTHNQGE